MKHSPGEQNIADPLSRLLQADGEVDSSSAHKFSDEFVRSVAVTATPQAMTTREIEEASAEDDEFIELRHCITNGTWKADQHKQYIPVSSELCVIGKFILRGTRIVILSKLRSQVLMLAHEGHQRIVSMKQRLRLKVWWPGIHRVEKFCKTGHGCQLVSSPAHPEPIKSPPFPWQDLALDLLGPLPSGDYVLVVVDSSSRYYECLEKIFTTHGLPVSVNNDNGPQFVSEVFEQYLEDCGIDHRTTTPLWPQANGEVERQNRSVSPKKNEESSSRGERMEERSAKVFSGIQINPSYDHRCKPGRASIRAEDANQIA